MNSEKILDDEIHHFETPAQAEKFYRPKLLNGKMDLMAIKSELREKYNFSEEDVRITARVLANARLNAKANDVGYGHNITRIILGLTLVAGGGFMIMWLWNVGWVSTIPFLISGIGFVILFKR